jgi:hypothetical protein
MLLSFFAFFILLFHYASFFAFFSYFLLRYARARRSARGAARRGTAARSPRTAGNAQAGSGNGTTADAAILRQNVNPTKQPNDTARHLQRAGGVNKATTAVVHTLRTQQRKRH